MKIAILDGIRRENIAGIIPRMEEVDLDGNPEAIFVRSKKLEAVDLPDSLCAVCRAGSGTDNVPTDWCNENGVVVFNAPGANANAVKELVLLVLLALIVRKIVPVLEFMSARREWPLKDVEKAKGDFRGSEIAGKRILVIGAGAIGKLVAKACLDLGMRVHVYDPFLPPGQEPAGSAREESITRETGAIHFAEFVTLHCSLTESTRGLINREVLGLMRDGAKLLNFARPEIVERDALKHALACGRLGGYISDFHDPMLASLFPDRVITFPHIGASTEEAEERAQRMVAEQFADFWFEGAIRNSVNFPTSDPKEIRGGEKRIVICNINIPGRIAVVSSLLGPAGYNYNIRLTNDNRGKVGYIVIHVDNPDEKLEEAVKHIAGLDGITRVRIIR